MILNRAPRLLYLSAYRDKRRIKAMIVPGANLAGKLGLSTEDVDAIRASDWVKELENRGELEFVIEEPEEPGEPEKPEPEPEPAPKHKRKPKTKTKTKTKPEPGREPEAEAEGSDSDPDDF